MPREKKKRGRRADKKKRKLDELDAEEPQGKRQKRLDADETTDFLPLVEGEDWEQYGTHATEPRFYGMLDEGEQNYFRQADERLELNDFADPEDRSLFLANVFHEAEGKELKMACSQSSSRLLERLIQLSTTAQLRQLFSKFNGQFIHLMTHRFASHCCEALFIQSASVVSADTLALPTKHETDESEQAEETVEDLFLHALGELEDSLGFLMTDKFASHPLRVLLLVLTGEPIPRSSRKGPLQSRKKENIGVSGVKKDTDYVLEKRTVPESFSTALEAFLSKCTASLNTDTLRLFATHQVGNPMLQLLLQLELGHFGKRRAKDEDSIIHKLLPDDPIAEGTDSAQFINGLVYDTVGSRLVEAIVEHAPGRMFKQLFREYFKERLVNLSKNDIASYVLIKVISRLNKEDLADVVAVLVPEIPTMVERNRLALIRALIERCNIRGVDTDGIAHELQLAYGYEDGHPGFNIARLLKLDDAVTTSQEVKPPNDPSHHGEKLHGSLLAQTMITVPGQISELVFNSLANLDTSLILSAAKDSSASYAVSTALTSPTASTIFLRKMIQQFYGHVGEMALDPSASRVIDAVWLGTHRLAFIRERVAEELAENEASLRQSKSGRAVWHNWRMNKYKRNRREWVVESRESTGKEGFVGFPGENADEKENGNGTDDVRGQGIGKHKHHDRKKEKGKVEMKQDRHWTAIEKARHKHAKEKERREKEIKKRDKGKKRKLDDTGDQTAPTAS